MWLRVLCIVDLRKDETQAAGISTEVLRLWVMEHRRDISAMGVRPTRRLLPPRVVRYMCREQGIDDEDFLPHHPHA